MNGANRYTDPIDRSISPATISSTSPTARIANGAKYGSSVTKFAWVKKRSVLSEKYTAARTVTTMMLPSRSVRKRRASSRAPGRRAEEGVPPSPAGTVAEAGAAIASGLGHACRGRGALEAALGVVVVDDGGLIEELQARVGVGDAREAAGRLVHEQLQDRQEALQIRLLVDGEVDLVRREQLLRHRREVVAAALDALLAQAVLLDRLREALRAARVDGEVALGVRMPG